MTGGKDVLMSKAQKRTLARIGASLLLFIAVLFLPLDGMAELIAYVAVYLLIGWDILWRAARNIAHGQVFDENFLMTIATLGAFVLGEYPEAVEVMLFYQVGEFFQVYAVGRSRRSISQLMDIRPDYANIEADGVITQVDPYDIAVGDTIVVKAGERVPLDGVVLEGSSALDTSALTGESLPRDVAAGDEVISGCVNINGLLRVEVTREFELSTVARILDLVENSGAKKARMENFITKFARWYTPSVVVAAALLALIPPLLLGGDWADWVRRALTFLVISCPCALVISVPLSFFGGIGGASKRGILVKGGNYLEALARADTIVFDKTGTLTKGSFEVTAVHPQGMDDRELLRIAAAAESYSDHPISRSLKEASPPPEGGYPASDAQEIPGRGVSALVEGRIVHAGNARLMDDVGVECVEDCDIAGTAVHVAADGRYAGHIIISDSVKPGAFAAIARLKEQGVRRTVMLTGDSEVVAESVAGKLGIDEYRAELLPEDKVAWVERLLEENTGKGTLAFVGDGINDAPVLSRADVGIAMGAIGSDAAIEAADIVLMDDDPSKLALAIAISRKTLRISRQNVAFALGVKAIALILGALGIVEMQLAVFADVGVSVLAILNAMRAMRTDGLI